MLPVLNECTNASCECLNRFILDYCFLNESTESVRPVGNSSKQKRGG